MPKWRDKTFADMCFFSTRPDSVEWQCNHYSIWTFLYLSLKAKLPTETLKIQIVFCHLARQLLSKQHVLRLLPYWQISLCVLLSYICLLSVTKSSDWDRDWFISLFTKFHVFLVVDRSCVIISEFWGTVLSRLDLPRQVSQSRNFGINVLSRTIWANVSDRKSVV